MQAQEAENAPDLAKDGGKAAYGGVREGRGRCCQALQGTRGAEAEAAAHHQPEVEGGGVNQQAFSDLLLSAHLDAAQPSAHKEVGEEPFQPLPPPAQQPLSPLAPDPAAVAVHGLLRLPLALPLPAAPVRLAHVAPQPAVLPWVSFSNG